VESVKRGGVSRRKSLQRDQRNSSRTRKENSNGPETKRWSASQSQYFILSGQGRGTKTKSFPDFGEKEGKRIENGNSFRWKRREGRKIYTRKRAMGGGRKRPREVSRGKGGLSPTHKNPPPPQKTPPPPPPPPQERDLPELRG